MSENLDINQLQAQYQLSDQAVKKKTSKKEMFMDQFKKEFSQIQKHLKSHKLKGHIISNMKLDKQDRYFSLKIESGFMQYSFFETHSSKKPSKELYYDFKKNEILDPKKPASKEDIKLFLSQFKKLGEQVNNPNVNVMEY